MFGVLGLGGRVDSVKGRGLMVWVVGFRGDEVQGSWFRVQG